MHLLASSPLKCYQTSTRKHRQSSALHRLNSPSVDIARKEKQKPGQNVPDFVREPWISAAPGSAGLGKAARRAEHTHQLNVKCTIYGEGIISPWLLPWIF